MGSLSKMLGMLPGMGQFRDQLENFDEREIDRIQAIIQSMTPAERANPKIINGSRRARIAKGSGPPGHRRQPARRPVLRGPQDDAEDGQGRRHARDAGHARHGRRQARQRPPGAAGQGKKGKGKRVSGNPAKRAQQEAGAEAAAAPAANPFGTAGGARSTTRRRPPQLDLPKDFSKYLK